MTPAASTIGENPAPSRDLSPQLNETQRSVTAAQRARELYRYFHPPTFRQLGTGGIYKSNVLSSQTELLALRLQCRVLINFLDESHEYRVAESVPTLSSTERVGNEEIDDSLWAQCLVVVVETSICRLTVDAPCPTDGSLPFFELLNVENDDRFASNTFVRGPPFIRYYFGVPLRTKAGITIGALAVIDSKPREAPLGEPERKCLLKVVQSAAENVMTYLELERESNERLRASNMNKSLNSFVDQAGSTSRNMLCAPSERLSSGRTPSPSHTPPKNSFFPPTSSDHLNSNPSSPMDTHQSSTRDLPEATFGSKTASVSTSAEVSSSLNTDSNQTKGLPFESPFRLAAQLLHQSLMLKDKGGVAFLDTSAATGSAPAVDRSSSERNAEQTTYDIEDTEPLSPTYEVWLQGGFRGRSSVIASSAIPGLAIGSEKQPEAGRQYAHSFIPMSVDDLSNLIEDNAHGKLWNLDEPEAYTILQSSNSRSSPAMEIAILRRSFPGATSLFMFPIWDARSVRWCALFAYSTNRFRSFTPETDVPHIISFCNCITLDLNRLATAAADKQKGDFIGSISHELRSPLHGILASCELLQDTGLTTFQQSFVETANSCGRTLLDTINMILDYSKITSLERTNEKPLKNPSDVERSGLDNKLEPPKRLNVQQASLSNLLASVDIAVVVEEVVEGAVIGHAFQGLQHVELSDMSSNARGRTRSNHPASRGRTRSKRPFEVILQITNNSPSSWLYKTQPGTFRRIVMNLVGNAMKYTRNGWVRVCLNAERTIEPILEDSDDNPLTSRAPKDIIVLKVEDTGKGMTSEFLDSRVFLPFSQEDTLSPGTGLGLSMVKSLLNTLDGQIHIESTVGRGTIVTVTIPMLQDLRNGGSSSVESRISPFTGGSTYTPEESHIGRLRTDAANRKVAFFCPDLESQAKSFNRKINEITKECVCEYVCNWFKMVMSSLHFLDESTDIIVANDFNLEDLLEELKSVERVERREICIVVLCDDSTRHSTLQETERSDVCMELIAKPFGPRKFAKAIQACLDKVQVLKNAKAARQGRPVVGELPQGDADDYLTALSPSDDITENLAVTDTIRANSDSSNAAMAMKSSRIDFISSQFPQQNKAEKHPTARVSPEFDRSTPEMLSPNTLSPSNTNNAESSTSVNLGALSSPPSQESQAPQTPTTPLSQRSPRVLVVDDNLVNLQLLEMFLKKLRYSHVSTAKDGEEACEAVETALADKQPFDVIFLDLSMPILDGFGAARRIRADEQRYVADATVMDRPAPAMIIALTGLASQSDSDHAFSVGVDLYMTKPASFKDISRVMNNWQINGGTAASDALPHGPLTGKASAPQ